VFYCSATIEDGQIITSIPDQFPVSPRRSQNFGGAAQKAAANKGIEK
jgi:hypothetical protein